MDMDLAHYLLMKTKKDKDNAVAMALPRPRRHT
jgi:hypothetical protein